MTEPFINLTPYALEHPIQVSESAYQQLVQRKQNGWSACSSTEECLAKLHYLRGGFQTNKLSEADFLEREERLVLNWWRQGL